MNRMFLLTSVLALGVIVSSNVVKAEDKDDLPSIHDVMVKLHGDDGKGGIKADVTKALKGGDWDDVKGGAKDWVKQAEALAKNKQTKGTSASWKKLTTTYTKNAKALATAAEKKDADGAKASLKSLGTSCGGCHGPHKPKKGE